MKKFLTLLTLALMTAPVSADIVLQVDFNSNQSSGGDSSTHADPGQSTANRNQAGWSSYHANHEVAAEFATANYGGITLTPSWKLSDGTPITNNLAMQSIDRGGHLGNWVGDTTYNNLINDYIGIDTRQTDEWNPGAGTGAPTYLDFTLGGLAAADYSWTSLHHDTENTHGDFSAWVSTDGGGTFTQLSDGVQTNSNTGGNPTSVGTSYHQTGAGIGAFDLPSVYNASFTATGADDVVMRFALHAGAINTNVHNRFLAINGFSLETVEAPEPPTPGILKVDFNSNQDGGGTPVPGDPADPANAAHLQDGWSSYHARHETPGDFTTATYGDITVTPSWSNSNAATVQQMLDRASGNDNQWDNAAGDINLVTDFIGTDTRTTQGGNGDWDGVNGTPTYMELTLGGLVAGEHDWTSFHHDTENVHGAFAVWISLDGGTTFSQLADGLMTDSSTGGSPDSGAAREPGPDAFLLPSVYQTSFIANGVDDVVLRFAPYSANDTHTRIWGMNGFILESPVIPEPTSALIGLAGIALVGMRRRRLA